jgi:hypothetical protein
MADSKVTALAALTSPATTDIIYVVADPGTTPVSKKMTLATLKTLVNTSPVITGDVAVATNVLFVDVSEAKVGINVSAPQGALEVKDGSLYLTDSDVNQPATAITVANSYGALKPLSGTGGGLHLAGASDTDAIGMTIEACVGSASPTVTPLILKAEKTDGSTGGASLAADEEAIQFLSGATVMATFLGDGKFGLGTTAPVSLLHLSGSAPVITLSDTDANASSIISANNTTGTVLVSADPGNAVASSTVLLAVDGTTVVTVSPTAVTSPQTGSFGRVLTTGTYAAGTYSGYFTGVTGAARDILYAGHADVTGGGFTVTYDGSKMVYTFADATATTAIAGSATVGVNLGVGTASPSSMVHLSGAAPIVTFSHTGSDASSVISADNATGTLTISADPGEAVNGSTIVLVVDGTTALTASKTIITPALPFSRTYVLNSGGTGTYGGYFLGASGAARDVLCAGQESYSAGFTVQFDGSKMAYTFADATAITSIAGLLGIGTTAPGALFEIKSASGADATFRMTDGDGASGKYAQWTAATVGGNTTLSLNIDGTTRFSVSPSLMVFPALGTGSTAAGSTLGTVVKKLQIYDASGNSLGFIPIYNAIT